MAVAVLPDFVFFFCFFFQIIKAITNQIISLQQFICNHFHNDPQSSVELIFTELNRILFTPQKLKPKLRFSDLVIVKEFHQSYIKYKISIAQIFIYCCIILLYIYIYFSLYINYNKSDRKLQSQSTYILFDYSQPVDVEKFIVFFCIYHIFVFIIVYIVIK